VEPVRGEAVERALGDRHLAEGGRVDAVDHDLVAGAEVAQVEDERSVLARRGLDAAVRVLDPGSRGAGTAEVVRDGGDQQAVATSRERRQRGLEV
jgi:hypothetical protein